MGLVLPSKKQNFTIEIIETLSKTIEIEACSKEEAMAKLHEKYLKEEVVLNSSHYISTEFLMKNS